MSTVNLFIMMAAIYIAPKTSTHGWFNFAIAGIFTFIAVTIAISERI